MRITFQNGTVHERARVAFVGVAAHILDIALRRVAERPLSACGESRAAAAAKSGCQHYVNYLVLRHFRQDLVQRFIAVKSDILLDVLGIDDAAVLERDPHLLGIEIRLAQRQDLAVSVDRLRIQKILADHSVHDVLVNDALRAFRRRL